MFRRGFSSMCINSFNKSGAWGLHTTLDIKDCCPHTIRDADKIKEYAHKLTDLIEMKRFGDTQVVHFGEDDRVAGFSLVQLLMTSNLTGHFANATNRSYIDIFSCKYYDPKTVEKFTVEFFKGKSVETNILLRK